MPFDHFCIVVPQSKLEDIIKFLTTSLAPTGLKEIMRPIPNVVGLGEDKAYFWISTFEPKEGQEELAIDLLKKNHIAFSAQSKSFLN